MTTGKKLLALAVLIIAGGAVIYGIQSYSLKKAEDGMKGPELTNGLLVDSVRHGGMTYLIPPESVYDYGIDVPEIGEASFTTVEDADEFLADDLPGIDVEVDGEHYYFAYQIMNWHEVARTDLAGGLSVTFDPLCYSPRVYDAPDAGILDHANKVYDNNALLSDENGNLWDQSSGLAVAGDRAGDQLETYPFTTMHWAEWKELYPNGHVLNIPEEGVRDYTRHPFGAYDDNDIVYFPLSRISDGFQDKWIADSFSAGGESIVFLRIIEKGFVAYDFQLGGRNYVALYDTDQDITRVYSADVEGQDTLTFNYDFDEKEIRDEQTNSLWNADGLAISGELKGTQLSAQQTLPSFWMCYSTEHDSPTVAHAENLESVQEQPEEVDIGV